MVICDARPRLEERVKMGLEGRMKADLGLKRVKYIVCPFSEDDERAYDAEPGAEVERWRLWKWRVLKKFFLGVEFCMDCTVVNMAAGRGRVDTMGGVDIDTVAG